MRKSCRCLLGKQGGVLGIPFYGSWRSPGGPGSVTRVREEGLGVAGLHPIPDASLSVFREACALGVSAAWGPVCPLWPWQE